MSMLAGPRRKQKVINLRAKNNAWSNDSSKFGQRMLERMGWTEGKGLGAKENGIVEHVVARYKNDEKGLGFEDKNDQWTKHEDDFNALLANLSNGDTSSEKLHSGVSLEDKSKKSKARVHYHKFTRGKDLTRYSEKDLANIFGKKTLKNEEKIEESICEEVNITEQVFTEKGSMEDYFKNKLAKFKSKSKLTQNEDTCSNENDYAFKGFSGTVPDTVSDEEKHSSFQPFSFYNNNISDVNDTVDHSELKKEKKSKKNKSKSQEIIINHIYDSENNQQNELDQETEILKPKKSKKKKQKKDMSPMPEEVETHSTERQNDTYVPKKKKKRKNKD